MGRFNIFEAIGAVRGELYHSNFLAYLISPARSHGYGARPLQDLLRAILAKFSREQRPISPLELILADLDGAVVRREWQNIDILVEIKALKLILLIENKVGAAVGRGQLSGYRKIIANHYDGWKQIFVLLSPDARKPDDPKYIALGYTELANLIEAISLDDVEITKSDAGIALRHYASMLRRHIVPDERLIELARQVYERHKEALDFIIENRPNADILLDPLRAILDGAAVINRIVDSTNILRFAPTAWGDIASLNVGSPNKWTRSGHTMLFEIKFSSGARASDRVIVQLIIGPAPAGVRIKYYNYAKERSDIFRGLVKPMGEHWSSIYIREILSKVESEHMTYLEKVETTTARLEEFLNGDFVSLTHSIIAAGDLSNEA